MLQKLTLALTLSLSTLAAMTLCTSTAEARDVIDLSQAQMVDASDFVVRGVVSEVWNERDTNGDIWTLASVEVTRVYKGQADTKEIIVHQRGGSINGEIHSLSVAARFSAGEEALFYLETNRYGRNMVVGGDQGKFTIRIDPDNGREMLVRSSLTQERYYDHRFLPHPPADQRVYLADVESQVVARVAQGWDGQPIPGTSLERLERVNNPSSVTQP